MNLRTKIVEIIRPLVIACSPVILAWAKRYASNPSAAPKILLRFLNLGRLKLILPAKLITGGVMMVNPFDTVGGEIYRHGCFEPETVNLVRKILKPGMTFLDIGANIGQYSVIASMIVGDDGKVYAFEPTPDTFLLLSENLKLNHCTNAQALQLALSDLKGNASLHLGYSTNSGANSLQKTLNTSDYTIEIETDTLDNMLGTIKQAELLKVDVEGAELLVLNGGEEFFQTYRPDILLELTDERFTGNFGYASEDLLKKLHKMGYQVFRITDDGIKPFVKQDDDPAWFNAYCVHNDRVSTVLSELN